MGFQFKGRTVNYRLLSLLVGAYCKKTHISITLKLAVEKRMLASGICTEAKYVVTDTESQH